MLGAKAPPSVGWAARTATTSTARRIQPWVVERRCKSSSLTIAKDQHVTRLVIRCPTANPIQHFPIWSERDSALAPVTRYNPKVSATTVVAERQKEQYMTDIMIRVEAEDYDAWLKTHYDHVEDRHSYGMTDGPVYRDIDNSNAALFHIHVENLDRAMQWFRTDTFKEATKRATVVGRDFYLAEKQQPRPQA